MASGRLRQALSLTRPSNERVRQIVQDRPAVHRSMVSIDDLIERYGPPVRRTAAAISSGLGHRAPAELRGPYKVGAFP